MRKTIVIQGEKITYKDIELVRQIINTNPSWKIGSVRTATTAANLLQLIIL